jgi:hypothetical protein
MHNIPMKFLVNSSDIPREYTKSVFYSNLIYLEYLRNFVWNIVHIANNYYTDSIIKKNPQNANKMAEDILARRVVS